MPQTFDYMGALRAGYSVKEIQQATKDIDIHNALEQWGRKFFQKQAKQREAVNMAEKDYDQKVRDFFAPLTDAVDAVAEVARPTIDPAFIYIVEEGEESVEGRPATIIELDEDTVILRLLDQGNVARLQWATIAGEDTILILEEPSVEAAPIVVPMQEWETPIF